MDQSIVDNRKKFVVFLVIFLGLSLFQLTELRYIWGGVIVAKIYNVTFLVCLSIYIAFSILSRELTIKVWVLYMLPGVLVFIGYFVNTTINTLRDPSLIVHYGGLFSWVVYLAVPFLLKDGVINLKKILQYYYYLTLLITIFGLFDYFLYFNNFVDFQVLNHPNGQFLSGWFSILHLLEDGSGHHRFYASMGEPGNLAMILVPSAVYSIVYKKYLGFAVFAVGIYLTDSLGVFIAIGVVIFFSIILLLRSRKHPALLLILSFALFLSAVLGFEKVYNLYLEKGESRITRVENIENSVTNLSSIVINYPFGIKFSNKYSENTDKYYYGSNFMPINALYKGGLVAVIGYIIAIMVFLMVSLSYFFRGNISRENVVASLSIISILPFIFQRTALLETSMLVLVFAPYIVSRLGVAQQENT